jgi:hypothetical protein
MWLGRTVVCDQGVFIEIPYLPTPYPCTIEMNFINGYSHCEVVRLEKSTGAPDEDSSVDRVDGISAALIGLPYKARLELVMSDVAFRAGFKDGMEIILIPELTHEDFAAMIGSSRFIVSRLIAEMISAGLVERSAKRYLLLEKWDFEPYIQLIRARPDQPGLAVPVQSFPGGDSPDCPTRATNPKPCVLLKPDRASYKAC